MTRPANLHRLRWPKASPKQRDDLAAYERAAGAEAADRQYEMLVEAKLRQREERLRRR